MISLPVKTIGRNRL